MRLPIALAAASMAMWSAVAGAPANETAPAPGAGAEANALVARDAQTCQFRGTRCVWGAWIKNARPNGRPTFRGSCQSDARGEECC